MRTLFLSVAALALAGAGQSFAQPEHAAHAAVAPASDSAEPTHEMCKSVMGRKMDGMQMHNHSSEKGAPMAGKTKPLTKAEMEKMHAKCAAKMAEPKVQPKK